MNAEIHESGDNRGGPYACSRQLIEFPGGGYAILDASRVMARGVSSSGSTKSIAIARFLRDHGGILQLSSHPIKVALEGEGGDSYIRIIGPVTDEMVDYTGIPDVVDALLIAIREYPANGSTRRKAITEVLELVEVW